jgi:6-phosphogluconolactonase
MRPMHPPHSHLLGMLFILTTACAAPVTEVAVADEPLRAASQVVYVSTNTGPIHVFSLDMASGQLSETSQISGGVNPSYMAFSPDQKYAYAIDEANPPDSKVLAFAIDGRDGHLTPINSVETGAVGAPHLAVHPSGKWLAVAHYGNDADGWTGGQAVVMPIHRDGSVGAAVSTSTGPSDHPCVNAHQAVFTTHGKYLLVPCLGSDMVVQYRFDRGNLTLNDPAAVEVASGSGPRHMALSRDGEQAYLITESGGTLDWFDYDERAGLLSAAGSVQASKAPIPAGGSGWSAHVLVHPTQNFLYVSNRQETPEHGAENSIGVFALGKNGEPTPILEAFVTEGVNTPRDFTIDPTGRYLISVNQAGDHHVLVFRIDPRTGGLTQTQAFPLSDQPAFVHALELRGARSFGLR